MTVVAICLFALFCLAALPPGWLFWTNLSEALARDGDDQHAIERVLQEAVFTAAPVGRPWTEADVARRLGWDRAETRRVLRNMAACGLVRGVSRQRFFLPVVVRT